MKCITCRVASFARLAAAAVLCVALASCGFHLRGEASLPQALAAAQVATRRYAKRQLTWLRNQVPDWPRLDAGDAEGQWRQLGARGHG